MARKRKHDAAVDEKERQRLALRAKLLTARDAALRAQYAPEPKDYAILSWPEMVTWLRAAIEAKEPDYDTAVHYLKRLLAEWAVNRDAIRQQCERLLLLSEGMTEHERFYEMIDQLQFNVHAAVGASIARLDLGEDDVKPEHYLTLESTVLRRVLEHAGRGLVRNLPDFNYNAARRRLRRERAMLKQTKPDLTKTETFLMLELLAADGRLLKIGDLMRSNIIDPTDTYDVGSEATVKAGVKRLIDLGYAERPAGKNGAAGRKGVRLTPTGKARAERLKEHPPAIF